MQARVALEGSRRVPLPDATRVASVDPHERLEATIVVRRSQLAILPQPEIRLSREAFAAAHRASDADLQAIAQFAHASGLTVTAMHPEWRSIRVAGPAEAMKAAFGTQLSYFQTPHVRYRGRVGALTLPADVAPLIEAVLGLDNRPVAKPHSRRHATPATARALKPTDIGKAYNFPNGVDGTGETIGIIELGGGFRTTDLDTYFGSLGIKRPVVSAVGVLTGTNNPGVDQGADGEVMLDIEVAGAIAPGAKIVVYFAPNTDQGFHDAIAQAVHDSVNQPTVISISWGGPEVSWTAQAMKAMNAALQDAAALGVTVTIAAGDDGSSDGVTDQHDHVDFPCSSPFALACGGTRLQLTGTGLIQTEDVWNELAHNEGATGGGFSAVFPQPTYQSNSNASTSSKMRGVPDVAGDADPTTGYSVLVDGSQEVIGGTSAVAPLWAGLIALVNQHIGKSVGFWNPALYASLHSGFNDITVGNNGSHNAAAGWDACTGLGTPDAKKLLTLLVGERTAVDSTAAESTAAVSTAAESTAAQSTAAEV